MTLVSEHIETDTRERILVVAERLFRQLGYQKTTVADIAKELRMSPANVYRFFDSKKAIHEGVARTLMGEVAKMSLKFGMNPPRPEFWGGFRLRPTEIEFWADGAFRLHDRFRFTRSQGTGRWTNIRLNP